MRIHTHVRHNKPPVTSLESYPRAQFELTDAFVFTLRLQVSSSHRQMVGERWKQPQWDWNCPSCFHSDEGLTEVVVIVRFP